MHDIMTVQEVAEYLRVSERTIYDWAAKNQIPCGKLGTTWRFKRAEIEQWVDNRLKKQASVGSNLYSIADILTPQRVLLFETKTKKEALERLIEVIAVHPAVKDKNGFAEGIFRREQLMSTGIGLGVAIPHVRLESIKELIMAVGITKTDIEDYDSLDGRPVRILFMVAAGKNQHVQYIKILGAISRLIKDEKMRNALIDSEDPQAVYNLLTTGIGQ
jgi:PTS system nitrogen regulatory IIA component